MTTMMMMTRRSESARKLYVPGIVVGKTKGGGVNGGGVNGGGGGVSGGVIIGGGVRVV